jgi:hypothetical protein
MHLPRRGADLPNIAGVSDLRCLNPPGRAGTLRAVTFEEKPAGAIIPGDQIVQRDTRLARARMLEVAGVERMGSEVVITFRRGSAPVRYSATTNVVVLPKVEREGWWVQA